MVKTGFTKVFEKLESVKPTRLTLKKGETLFNQGDAVENIYIITLGKIKLVRNTIDGTPVVLHLGQHGEAIAEASLFSDQYHCSAIAASNSCVSYVKKEQILMLLEKNPKDMKNLLAVFARQVRDLRAINEIKNIRSANDRILAFIRCNVDSDNRVMDLKLPLKEIAYRIGLAHETFYRELKKLEDSGSIIREGSQIELIDHTQNKI